MSLGPRLKRLRLQKGLTQKELAEPEYTHAYVSTIESGRRSPSPSALGFFADKLGVGLEELVTGRSPTLTAELELALQEARVMISAGDFDQAEARFKDVRNRSKRFGLSRFEARACELGGLLLERQGKIDEALEHYEDALRLLEGESPSALAYATAGKARCAQIQGDIHYAAYLLENLITSLRVAGLEDPAALVRVQAPLVRVYLELGLQKQAAAAAAEALRLAPDVSDRSSLAQMYVNVAGIHVQRGELDEADSALRRAEDLFREMDLRHEVGRAHLARGLTLSRQGDLDDAREQLDAARTIFQETGDDVELANTCCEIARVSRLEGNLVEARELLTSAIDMLRRTEDPHVLAWAHRELGVCYEDQDPALAEKNFKAAIELYERTGEVVELATTYRTLGDLLHRQGNDRAGCEAFRTGIVMVERLYG
jgi:tetratricopeptide (TPR) repeat protein